MPGGMMLQRIRSLANWIASDFVSEMSAPLAAVYASWARVNPASAETEPIRITEPPPARRSSGIPYFVTQKADLRLMAITRSHHFSSVSSTDRSRSFHSTPALLSRTSSRPKWRAPSAARPRAAAPPAPAPPPARAPPPPPPPPARHAPGRAREGRAPGLRGAAPLTKGGRGPRGAPPPGAPPRVRVALIPTADLRRRITKPATDLALPGGAQPQRDSGRVPRGPAIPGAYPSAPLLSSPPSDPLEVAHQLPVRDHLVEGLLFEPGGVQVVLDDALTQGGARDLRALELGDRLAQCLGHLGERRVLVRVPLVELGRLQPARDAVEPRRDRRGEREIGVRVRARDPVLDAQARTLAAEPEAARAIVPPRDDARRRERARLITLVGVHARRVEVRELAGHQIGRA